jgi:hypothetical protein
VGDGRAVVRGEGAVGVHAAAGGAAAALGARKNSPMV